MTAPLLEGGAALRARLSALTRFLIDRRSLWQVRPFATLPVPWADEIRGAAAFFDGLTHEDVDRLEERVPWPPDEAPPALAELSRRAHELTRVGEVPRAAAALQDRRLQMRVPGRKWAQVERFAAAVLARRDVAEPARWVDWCAGKGHLGRTLAAASARPASLVEIDAGLGASARAMAERVRAEISFVQADALAPAAAEVLGADAHAVALHACGGLTNALLEGVARRGAADLVVAPCCYHKAHPVHLGLEPMSEAGRAAGLPLSHGMLRLATADEVVAPGRQRRGRRRDNAWRLGLDLLVRQATGRDVYTPLGVLPKPLLRLPFEAFCHEVAAIKGLPLPARWSPAQAQEAGAQRALEARRWGLARSLFRRPLELWLVLDRALYLVEAGRAASVGVFCPRAVTPRNLLILSSARSA
ncbi:MAG: SAM-dependent methyltransferase [Proteobacteria bacterium]|nr:MAG: SAM-dependent methyltransferase [Pseudomonadota bacterium]